MRRLIDANDLAEQVWDIGMYIFGVRNGKTLIKEFLEKYRDSVMRKIANAPTVDAVEVVHGRWLDYSTIAFTEKCSVCGFCVPWKEDGRLNRYNYCPNCGAKMDGDGNG